MKSLIIYSLTIAILIGQTACNGSKSPAAEEAEHHHEDEHEDLNTTWLSDEQIKSIGIELGKIEDKQLTETLKTSGKLKVPNQYKANINSMYRGIIKSLSVQPGNRVSQGQIIATLQNPEYILIQEEYLNTQASIELSELDFARQSQLNTGNAGALKNLQAVESELKKYKNKLASLRQQLELMHIRPDSLRTGNLNSSLSLRAPISGIVSEVMVDIGTYVDFSTPIAKIIDNSQLHLDLFVFEKDLPKLKNNQIIHFTLTNNPGKEYDAQIFSLGSSFEGESKVVSVHAKVQGDKSGLIDGMNVTAIISLSKANQPAIPTEAIVSYQGQDYIFIVTESPEEKHHHESEHTSKEEVHKGLTFEKIPIARGVSDVGYTQITLLKDLPKDAQIIVKGAFFVLAKLTNTGEHEH